MSEPVSAPANLPAVIPTRVSGARQQLGDLPIEELRTMAEEFGVSVGRVDDKAKIIAALHTRRQVIASLDRAAVVDVLEWAARPVVPGASLEQMAMDILHVRSMRFSGLSDRGLLALALLRGCDIAGVNDREEVARRLKSQEGFVAKMRRKTRGWVAKRMEKMIGDSTTPPGAAAPPPPVPAGSATVTDAPRPQQALKEEIESSGFFGGIANRVKRQADTYVNQKLDEIESRIDRKLDEIDRRLAEWRDKEIANRIRILKLTLWVSVIVAVISLIYSYIQVEARHWNDPTPTAHLAPPPPVRP